MLDIKFIRENKDLVAAGAKKKLIDFNIDELIAVDDARRALLVEVEAMRGKQNETASLVPRTQDQGERDRLIVESKSLKDILQKKEELTEIMKKWQGLMVRSPIFLICLSRKVSLTLKMLKCAHGEIPFLILNQRSGYVLEYSTLQILNAGPRLPVFVVTS
jgi:hypothetical protein